MRKLIKILVVDDSEVIRDFLVYLFTTQSDMMVIGTAKNGKEAVEKVRRSKPDIVTMDIEMPVMNGYEATKEIMTTNPVPIIVITASYQKSEVEKTFKAMDAGAVSIFEKLPGFNNPEFEKQRQSLMDSIRAMSEVKLVTRSRHSGKSKLTSDDPPRPEISEQKVDYKIVVIGVSTGGPPILNSMFREMPANFRLPVLVVQHIPEGFLEGMVDWLNLSSKLHAVIAEEGMEVLPGKIYFNPPEKFMSVKKDYRISLRSEYPDYVIKPSVSYLFKSVAASFGHESVGILLSGMGKDGAEELLTMKEKGALTIAQDEESSVINGMPGTAVEMNACRYILSPDNIVRKLTELNDRIIRKSKHINENQN